MQHAHQKGIIHRDLKPSNILVAPYDDKPVPKVIDFGLAKAMHQSLTERTLHTAHDSVLGTPLYMSPEQAQLNNLDVDTRSDIYSLGVVLYELLTGTTPLDKQRFKEAAWDEIRRLIREEEPPRPSARLSSTDTLPSIAAGRQIEPLRLTKLVRGELDWIVMKALEKDRSRRYETANGFAMDVQRYLADEAVLACPPSLGYRLWKFARRNSGPVLAATGMLALLVAGLVVSTALAVWARKAEHEAVTAWGEESKQRKLADDRLAQVTEEKERAERLFKLGHESLADLIGHLHGSWKTIPLKLRGEILETVVRNSVGIFHELETRAGANPDKPDYTNQLAIYVEDLAGICSEGGKTAEAEIFFRRATRWREQLHRDHPVNEEYRRRLGKTYRNVGMFRRTAKADFDGAVTWYDQSIATLKPLVEGTEPDRRAREELLDVYRRRAEALMELVRNEEAVRQWDVALRLDTGEWRNLFRHQRAIAMALTGDHRAATAEADDVTKTVSAPGAIYLQGAVYSLAFAAAGKDRQLPAAERQQLAERYATRAVNLLREAAEKGFATQQRLAQDPKLDPLRGREDFQQLLRELGGKQ